MLELLASALIVGQCEIGPGLVQVDYLQHSVKNVAYIVTVIEDRD